MMSKTLNKNKLMFVIDWFIVIYAFCVFPLILIFEIFIGEGYGLIPVIAVIGMGICVLIYYMGKSFKESYDEYKTERWFDKDCYRLIIDEKLVKLHEELKDI